jgi:hypothetical protein
LISGDVKAIHIRLARIALVTLAHPHSGGIHAGLVRQIGETVNRIYRRWGTEFLHCPCCCHSADRAGDGASGPVQLDIGAVKAEFTGASFGPETAPAQPSKAATEIRTVKAN